MLEMNLRQSVILSGGDIGILVQRPIALTFVVATGLLVLHLLWSSYRQYRQRRQHG